MLMEVSLIQGGSGYPFFAPSTFSYLSGTDVCSILVDRDEIADVEVKQALKEVIFISFTFTVITNFCLYIDCISY